VAKKEKHSGQATTSKIIKKIYFFVSPLIGLLNKNAGI
jgi:hypothetical protein